MLLALDSVSDALSESFPSHTSGAESGADSLDSYVDAVELKSVPLEPFSSHKLLASNSESFTLSDNSNVLSESEHSDLCAGQ